MNLLKRPEISFELILQLTPSSKINEFYERMDF